MSEIIFNILYVKFICIFLGSAQREIYGDYYLLEKCLNEDIKNGHHDYKRKAFPRYFGFHFDCEGR